MLLATRIILAIPLKEAFTCTEVASNIIIHPCHCPTWRQWRRQLRGPRRRGQGRRSNGRARICRTSNTARVSLNFPASHQSSQLSIYLHPLQLAQEPALVVIAGGRRDETVDERLAVGGHIRTALLELRTVDSHLETVQTLKLNVHSILENRTLREKLHVFNVDSKYVMNYQMNWAILNIFRCFQKKG